MTAGYQQALDFLFPRTTQIKFGLATTEALLAAVGNPHTMFPTIHIGGTNGKGSTSTLIAAALREKGLRVGLYTSPHLISFRERIRVDGVDISEAAVAAWMSHLRSTIERTEATFFEATTAIAFADFAAREVDIAVVEVGLGGRLDSTNVIRPLVSAVTHIALDHQRYLGETLEEIAREKAGIAKPNTPFIIGEPDLMLAAALAAEGQEAVRRADPEAMYQAIPLPDGIAWRGRLAMLGAHQRRNASIAAAVLYLLPHEFRPSSAEISTGFEHARLAGRLDRRGKWLFDVAHNPDGMRTLTAAIGELQLPGPVHALVSILGDKEWPEMLVDLDRAIDVGILTVAPSADTRRWDLGWLERWLADPARPPAHARWRLIPDFEEALAEAEAGAGTIVVTGSFHTVGDVMQARGLEAG